MFLGELLGLLLVDPEQEALHELQGDDRLGVIELVYLPDELADLFQAAILGLLHIQLGKVLAQQPVVLLFVIELQFTVFILDSDQPASTG